MTQIVVSDLEDEIIERLKRLAEAHGRSLEIEVRMILDAAASRPNLDWKSARERLEALRQSLAGRPFPSSVELIREDRE